MWSYSCVPLITKYFYILFHPVIQVYPKCENFRSRGPSDMLMYWHTFSKQEQHNRNTALDPLTCYHNLWNRIKIHPKQEASKPKEILLNRQQHGPFRWHTFCPLNKRNPRSKNHVFFLLEAHNQHAAAKNGLRRGIRTSSRGNARNKRGS
jgi:hypothetical protein